MTAIDWAEVANIQKAELDKALEHVDWMQVVLNGGPPCFFVEHGRFCLRAERWGGHGSMHPYIDLKSLVLR